MPLPSPTPASLQGTPGGLALPRSPLFASIHAFLGTCSHSWLFQHLAHNFPLHPMPVSFLVISAVFHLIYVNSFPLRLSPPLPKAPQDLASPQTALTSKDTNLCISPQAPAPSKSATLRDDPPVSQTHRPWAVSCLLCARHATQTSSHSGCCPQLIRSPHWTTAFS